MKVIKCVNCLVVFLAGVTTCTVTAESSALLSVTTSALTTHARTHVAHDAAAAGLARRDVSSVFSWSARLVELFGFSL